MPEQKEQKTHKEYYDDKYYDVITDRSYQSARIVLGVLFDIFKPNSVADFGCGRGAWLAAARELGSKILHGYDGSWVDKSKIYSKDIVFIDANFEQDMSPRQKYDLAISLEVAEHLSKRRADSFVDLLTGASDVVVFGAAICGQGGENHLNEQWQSYWIEKFKQKGFECYDIFRPKLWNNEDIEWWYRQNTFLFVKDGAKNEKISGSLRNGQKFPIYNLAHPAVFEEKVGELSMERKELTKTEKELTRTEGELRIIRNKLIRNKSELLSAEENLEEKINELKLVKSSKFWKMRQKYMKLKRMLKL